MRRRFALALLLMPALSFAAPVAPTLTNGPPLIVSESQMALIFKQCSRRAPKPNQVLGAATAAEIEAFESGLKSFLSIRHRAGKRIPPTTVVYDRQYVAYLKGSSRKIYGNFIPAAIVRELREDNPSDGHPLVICDGGPAFWGVVYDGASKTFEQLEFNGP